MTAKKNDIQLDDSSYIAVEVNNELKIVAWRGSSAVLRTKEFIKACKTSPVVFFDKNFLKHAEDWIGVLLQYEDSFCGDHAVNNWDTQCKNFLGDILNQEDSAILETAVNEGAIQGYYTFVDSADNSKLLNFSWILWLLGLADEPFGVLEENKLKISLINQGKLVLVQLKTRRIIHHTIVVENAPIDYNITVNIIDNNKGNIGSVGASGNSRTTQKIEVKKDSSWIESLMSLKVIIPAIVILVLLVLFITGKLTLADIKELIPKF